MKSIISLVILVLLAIISAWYFWPSQQIDRKVNVDKLVVYKTQRVIIAYSGDTELVRYNISLGKQPEGDKLFEGDGRTPIGKYVINAKNANSSFHKNLGISYPNAEDIQDAYRVGKSAGGDIKIHGMKNGRGYIGKFHQFMDWTNGCIAVTNSEMDQLYSNVAIGTPIYILD